MKRIAYLAVFILTLAVLAACQQEEEPTPTAEPEAAEEPTAEPAEEPAQEAVEEPAEEAAAEALAAPVTPPGLIGMQTERLRALDFSPFEEALAGFSEERAAAVEAVVTDATIPDVQAALQAGELTSEELTLWFLSRIRQYDEGLRSYTEINPSALEEARAADELRAAGTVLGPLQGIPVNLKDNIGTAAPMHTTGGAEILLDYAPAEDAPLVTQLREAGAVILGKANLSELAGGVALFPAGYTAVAGQTINPYGADFPTLGSSSGSAASTAAMLTMASVGSETGGSLIAPSALNGVVGMYPTDDLVSDEGVIPLVSSTDTPGPIARSVTDAAVLLGAIDSADVDYTASLDVDALNGVAAGFFAADLSPDNTALNLSGFEDTSDQGEKVQLIEEILGAAGVQIVPAELLPIDELAPSDELIMSMFGPTLAQMGITDLSEVDDDTRAAIEAAITIPGIVVSQYFNPLVAGGIAYDMVDYLIAAGAPITSLADFQAYNNELSERRIPNGQWQIDDALPKIEAGLTREAYEQLAADAQPALAAELDAIFEATGAEVLVSMVNEHSSYYALAGYPAITVPLGLRANGAPTGVTLIGKPGTDAQLLAYAYAFEQASMLRVNPDLHAAVQQTGSTETSAVTADWEPVGCETFGIEAAIAGALQCGYVTVPENRAAGGDATIRLAVARVPTDAESPGAPVFEGTGGPGSSGFADATAGTLGERAEILADRDWIFFSQRGTEFSEPFLNCPDYSNAPFEGGINGWTSEELIEYRNDAFQACVEEFRAQGVDLSAYNSNENAADVDAIRQALGYDQIIYYGESYGTQLGQFLMRNHPEILQAVILDGVVPVERERANEVTDIAGAFERVFDGCAADPACSSAYSDPRAEFAAAIDAIRANPPTLPVTLGGETVEMEVDSTLAMNAMFLNLYLTRGYAQVPSQVRALAAGDYSPLQTTIPVYFSASNNARVQHFAINCSDDPLNSLDELELEGLADHYQELILDDAQALANLCPILDLPQLDAVSDEPVTADIPVLLLQGGYDPSTPVEGGNLVDASLPNSTNAVFPAGTHIQSGDPCALAIMDAFMSDPTTTPDTSCIDPQVTFAVPLQAQINSADGARSMTLELSPGYMLADPQGPLQVFVNLSGTTGKQFFAAIWGADEQADAQSALDFMIDEVLGLSLEEREYYEGDAVAGYPTQRLRGAIIDPSGQQVGVDGVAFEDEDGRIYSMLFATLIPAQVEAVRKFEIPAALESITLGEGG